MDKQFTMFKISARPAMRNETILSSPRSISYAYVSKPVKYTDPVHRMMTYHTFTFSHILFREDLENPCATIMYYAEVQPMKNNIFYLDWTRHWQDKQRLRQGVYTYFGPWNNLACPKAHSLPYMADKCPCILSAVCVCVPMRTEEILDISGTLPGNK